MGNVSGTRDSSFPAAMGKYTPFARLGKGGMAEVFLAVARGPAGFNKLAVVKRLRDPESSQHVTMFLDEARLAARLNHPNIVHTYEVGEADNAYFLAMEYLEGQSLQVLVRSLAGRGEAFDETLAASLAVKALKGLHYAHELADFDGAPLGIVHRDLSPHNIFVTYAGEIKLLDFGIAKTNVSSSHTETGILKGKVRYMAPEQAREKTVDRRADIFAFGIVLWEMLAGRPLFQGASVNILARLVNEDIPPVRSVRASIAAELDAIVQKAVARDKDRRFATADEMRVALEGFLRERAAPPPEKDLARLMTGHFAEKREEARVEIKRFLAELPEDVGASRLALSRSMSMSLPLVEIGPMSAPGTVSRSVPMAVLAPDPLPPTARRARSLPTALGFVVFFAAVGALWVRGAGTVASAHVARDAVAHVKSAIGVQDRMHDAAPSAPAPSAPSPARVIPAVARPASRPAPAVTAAPSTEATARRANIRVLDDN